MDSDDVVNSPIFECVGHSLHMALSHTLWLLHASFDRDVAFLPDPRKWEEGFDDLRKHQVPGYYYGGRTEVVPLGAKAIFEGQARFSEVQYLHLVSGRKLQWIDFERDGMFRVFISVPSKCSLSGLKWTGRIARFTGSCS